MSSFNELNLDELRKWERWAATETGHKGAYDHTLRHQLTKELRELREWRKWAAELGQPADAANAADALLRTWLGDELTALREPRPEIDNGT